MYRIRGPTRGNVVGVLVDDELTREDLRSLPERLQRMVERHGRLRLLLSLDGVTLGDDVDEDVDLEADLGFGHELERLAVIVESPRKRDAERLFHTLDGETRVFSPARQAEAWRWLALAA